MLVGCSCFFVFVFLEKSLCLFTSDRTRQFGGMMSHRLPNLGADCARSCCSLFVNL
jgi:hypothetical protein